LLAWDVISACRSQVRTAGTGAVVGLDYGAILMVAQARGADCAMVADLLPDIEGVILTLLREERDAEGD
jgi:hypothetical protein